jgi:hypothetical protein
MAFSSTITITGSTNITNFDIFQCPTSGCTGCVAITGSTGENVSRMKLLTGHTVTVSQGYRYIKLVADTATCNNSICMEVVGIPTFTPTPTPTRTPTPTPTPTTVGPTSTPTPTATPLGPTSTPTPTPTIGTPTPTPTSTNTPTPTPTSTPTPTPNCSFGVNISSPTATYYNVTVRLNGFSGCNGNLQIWQSADNSVGSFQQALVLTSTDTQSVQQSFNGTPGYYYYMIVARTSGTSATRLNLYTQVDLTDFSPGPINGAWCSSPNSTPLQSDVFRLPPTPIQSRQSITFFGNLDIGCL